MLSENLEGITQAHTSKDGKTTTTLSKTLAKNTEFMCRGHRPWLGPDSDTGCNAHIKGSLRSASNVYFAKTPSSIYLPRVKDRNLQELEVLLGNPPLSTLINILSGLGMDISEISETAKSQQNKLLAGYTKKQINSVLEIILSKGGHPDKPQDTAKSKTLVDEDEQTAFRRSEYEGLKNQRDDLLLKIKSGNLRNYSPFNK